MSIVYLPTSCIYSIFFCCPASNYPNPSVSSVYAAFSSCLLQFIKMSFHSVSLPVKIGVFLYLTSAFCFLSFSSYPTFIHPVHPPFLAQSVRQGERAGAAHQESGEKGLETEQMRWQEKSCFFPLLPPVSFVVSAQIKIWWSCGRTTIAATTITSQQAAHSQPDYRSSAASSWLCSRLTAG